MVVTFGKVPMPAHVRKIVPAFEGQAAGYYGPRHQWSVVWHRMVGNMNGTWQHFNSPGTGLTDFAIGNANVDGEALDGVIWMFNDPFGSRSGWANGRVIAPYGDGLAFVNDICAKSDVGINAVNRDQVSIELSGLYTTPMTPKMRASLIKLTAYFADRERIPWNEFPIWPGHGYSFVKWHQEYTGPQEKICPGGEVIGETAVLIDLTAQYMRTFQEASAPAPTVPTYYKPSRPSWLLSDIQAGIMRDHVVNDIQYWGCEREFTAIRETPRRQVASLSTDRFTGPPIKKGEKFRATHRFGNWVITPYGTRVYALDLTPEVVFSQRGS